MRGRTVTGGPGPEPGEDHRNPATDRLPFSQHGLRAHPQDRPLAVGLPGPHMGPVIEDAVAAFAGPDLDSVERYRRHLITHLSTSVANTCSACAPTMRSGIGSPRD